MGKTRSESRLIYALKNPGKLLVFIQQKFNNWVKITKMYSRKYWLNILHAKSVSKRKREVTRIQLDKNELETLEELKRLGFCFSEDLVNKNLLKEIDEQISVRLCELDEKGGIFHSSKTMGGGRNQKNYFSPLLKESDFNSDSAIIRYATQDTILKIVSCYLGQAPYLATIELILSRDSGEDSKGSQLWHRDLNDSKMCKLFTYFTDVNTHEQGPLALIPANKCDGMDDPLFPVHKTDEMMRRYSEADDIVEMYGPKHTVFLGDTYRCYHRGSRVKNKNTRIALIIGYTTIASFSRYDNKVKITGPVSERAQRTVINEILGDSTDCNHSI